MYTTGPISVNTFMKQCKTCNTLKPLDTFRSGRNTCKECTNQQRRDYYSKNREVYQARGNDYYSKNRELILSKRVLKIKPPRKTIEETKERQAAYKRRKRRTDPVFRLRSNIGSSIANALAARGYKKTSKTFEILGCSFEEFKHHIEQQFLPGMAWQNRSEWHLDHIVPVSFAISEAELLSLNHYSNLRPLWGVDNQNKAARLTEESVSHSLYKTIIENRICDQKFCAQNFFLTAEPISECNNGTI